MRPSKLALLLAAASASLTTGFGAAGLGHAAAQTSLPASATATVSSAASDPFLWLEDVDGKRSLDWVEAENARSLKVLENDPRYAGLHDEALALAQAKDRIPSPDFLGGQVYNFWQDADHVRGVWRATSVADYAQPEPEWRTVLDLDALAKAENANWVYKGVTCERPHEELCLVALSDGGEDAVTLREFDLSTSRFVDGGFNLSRSKQQADWIDSGTLIVARDWGQGSMTASGYPFVVKVLHRGQQLRQAQEVFRGEPTDEVGVTPRVLVDGQGRRAIVITRGVTFFQNEHYLVTPHGGRKLALPPKSDIDDLVAGRLIVTLREDWSPMPGGTAFKAGSVISLDLSSAEADPDHLAAMLVWAPGPRQALSEVSATRNRLVVTGLDNVRGRAWIFSPVDGAGWTSKALDLPDNATISLVSTSSDDDQAFLGVTGFLTPSTLWLADGWSGMLRQVKALPAKFDAANLVTEQFEATSKDGTRVPYFLVHRKDIKLDGSTPTLLYGYGGFEVSMTPTYSPNLGKLWLERGGAYALANIRGGGEFGPAWHEAALTVHRQRAYDDFAAVGQDLIARKITSPRRLGIRGGSNGGLLMGVEFEQHPELWNATIIEVPLLDMLRFEQIAAGASWVGEYGSVADPAQRAFLASISPYANLKAGAKYPEPFIFTTTKDDRVGPVHARKFAAEMEALGLPFLYYENTEGGHAAGANLRETAHEQALEMTYLTQKLMD
jgi:prolyl oligopeptidase